MVFSLGPFGRVCKISRFVSMSVNVCPMMESCFNCHVRFFHLYFSYNLLPNSSSSLTSAIIKYKLKHYEEVTQGNK